MPVTRARPFAALLARAWTLLAAVAIAPNHAHAHAPAAVGTSGDWAVPLSWTLYAAAWGLYLSGALRTAPDPRARAAFHGGMLLTGLAVFGPIDAAAADSTAMHMVQHMLLITVVAPLLVLARPLPQWRAGLAGPLRPAMDRAMRPMLRSLRRPMLWALLHGAALWLWHLPGPYTAALQHEGLHALEHACFLLSAWAFWWTVLRAPAPQRPLALMGLLFTLMHTGFLGAVLVFAARPLYFAETRSLGDQQLAGLLMWAPGGIVYIAAAAWVARHWLTHAHTERVRA